MQSSLARSLASGLLALAASVVAACATTNDELAAVRESWRGATYDDLVRTWGPPARSGKLGDGAEVHTWVSDAGPAYRSSGASIGFGGFRGSGGGSGVGVGVGIPIGGTSTPAPPARCERTLTFRDGRVVEQSWIGPDEVCAEFTRAKPG